MNKKKELAKNTIIIFAGKVCTQLISFLLLPLYTSYLLTEEYGFVDLITTYVTLIVPIITMELEMSVFRYLVDCRKDKKETKRVFSNNFIILLFSLFIFIIGYLIVTCFWKFDYRFLILFDIVICTFSGNFLQIARGVGRTLDYAISCIITGVSTILLNILLIVVFKLGAFGMITSMAVANGLGALYLFIRLKMWQYIDFKKKDKKLIKEMYKYSVPLVPNGISWWIVNVSDRTIITAILGAAANGIYAVSNKFPTILSSLLGIFNLSWSESAALHINSPDRDQFFSDISNTVTKLFTCLGVGMIACMPFVFPLLVNHSYDDAYYYIPILILGAVFNVVICLYSAVYIAKKMTKQVAMTSIIGAVINIVVNVGLIHFIGLFAAALSTAVSYLVMMIYRHFDLKKYINITYEKGLLIKTILIFTFAIVIYYQRNLYLDILSLIVVVIYSILMNKDFLSSSFHVVLSKMKGLQSLKVFVLLFGIAILVSPMATSAKEDRWLEMDCDESWWLGTKLTCDIYSTKTAKYPKLKKFSASLDYNGLKFSKFTSSRSEVKYKNDEIYMTSLKKQVKKGEKLGTLTFKVTNKQKYSIYVDEFYYQFKGNNMYNSNWLFLGDSFFDMLDGANMNGDSSTIVGNGYYNHTDNKYKITNGKREPSLGKISSLGISGATSFLISSYFNGLDITYLPDFPKLNKLPKNINKVAIYLGTNDARNYVDGDINYSPEAVSSYMKNIVEKLNEKYDNPEIYILRLFGRPRQTEEEVVLKQYNQKYQKLSQTYDNVSFINTEYLSNYQLANQTGLLRDSYYAFYTQKGYGYAGHLTVDAYDSWVDHLITSLTMNYGVSGNKTQGYSKK